LVFQNKEQYLLPCSQIDDLSTKPETEVLSWLLNNFPTTKDKYYQVHNLS